MEFCGFFHQFWRIFLILRTHTPLPTFRQTPPLALQKGTPPLAGKILRPPTFFNLSTYAYPHPVPTLYVRTPRRISQLESYENALPYTAPAYVGKGGRKGGDTQRLTFALVSPPP